MSIGPQVIIVGGGPSGCLLALRLIREGIKVCLIESDLENPLAFRALGYPGPTHLALHKAGIWEEAKLRGFIETNLAWRKVPKDIQGDGLEKAWGEVIVEWNPYKHSPLKPGDIGYGTIGMPQNLFREIIMPKLLASKLIDVYLGYTVTSVQQNTEFATVTAVNGVQGKIHISAPFLVGADGGKSITRKSLGLELEGFTWDDVIVAVDLWVDLPPSSGTPFGYIVDPESYAFMGMIEKTKKNDRYLWRVSLSMSEDETNSEQFDTLLRQKLERLIPGRRPLSYDLLRSQPYHVHQRHVRTMLSGRCMLIGDAAHLTNPFGGLGLTSAILDTDSLADALVYVINGENPETLLQKWSDARLEAFKHIVDPVARANIKRCRDTDPEHPFTDPFFRMIRDDTKELGRVNETFGRMVTDISKLLD